MAAIKKLCLQYAKGLLTINELRDKIRLAGGVLKMYQAYFNLRLFTVEYSGKTELIRINH